MNFFCIADKESGLGFRLAGIETHEVLTRPEALEALKVARATKELGIILITEKAADFLREEIEVQLTENPLPLILEIPSKDGARKKKSAAELLRHIAGM